MRSAFIVDGLRTPIGRRGGSLKGIHAIDLLGLVIENLVSRNDIDPIDLTDPINLINLTGSRDSIHPMTLC